ncbi:MAG: undecaprenyl/decaprenyl-phosphate alpha-N-acetylglucosaminyl 1-phosphate transferase [Clostridiales bacterium]|jgi:UDP-GlcNAc:undecaprenyl-phosphate GlcNAc-1-phosphate transferase|nr:undecaprenyl/decaprenyl-phosphate alpha-N-acetylglucosaminyl 1-phosphate transferase [Clostridiales bacterium]
MIQLETLKLIFVFIVAFLLSFAATPIVRTLAFKVGAVDVPKDERRVHSKPIPRLGGVAIFYGFIIAVLCFLDISTAVRGILVGSLIIITLGFIDDIADLPAILKLAVQILAAWVVVWHGVKIDLLTNPFAPEGYLQLGMWGVPVTILWIVGITNAVNMLDGLDGLAVGVSSITAVTLFVISITMGQLTTAILSIALAGAGFGFVPFNFHPAKIFMGDTGSTFLGFMLASVSILGLFKVYAIISFAVPFFILGLPILDTGFAILRRIAHGQSPMRPDRRHLHHRLIDKGFSQKQAVTILYILSSLLSLSAIVMMLSDFSHALILIFAVVLLAVVAYTYIFARGERSDLNEE